MSCRSCARCGFWREYYFSLLSLDLPRPYPLTTSTATRDRKEGGKKSKGAKKNAIFSSA